MAITPVIQYATVTDAVEAANYTVSGQITFASVGKKDVVTVTPAASSYLGNFTSNVVNDAQAGFKDFNWSFKLSDAQIAALAAGQSVIQTYNVLINGVPDQVIITILGTNDVPTITAQTQVKGTVTEDKLGGLETASGSFTFADKDLADTHFISGVQLVSNDNPQGQAIGALTALVTTDTTGTGKGGVVSWNYAASDAQLQFLAAGQKITEVYQITLSDGRGGTVTQNVTVTIVGTNDGPVIAAAPIVAAANGQGHAGGSFAFTDVDLIDTHTLSFSLDTSSISWSGGSKLPSGVQSALSRAFSAQLSDSTGTGTGSVAWNFDPASTATDFLAAGETLTATYQVKVKDNHGASAIETVTVTLTGSNHAPTIVASTADRVIHERSTARDFVDKASGRITFADGDRSDVHTAGSSLSSAVLSNGHNVPAATLAALSSALTTAITNDTTGGGNGTLKWNFQLDNKLATFLAKGESMTVTYDVTVSDGHGGIVHQPVTVTIDGRNFAPALAAGKPLVLTGSVTEFASGNGTEQASGQFSFVDRDFSDTHHVKSIQLVSGGAHHQYGQLTASVVEDSLNGGTGKVVWNYTVNDADIAFLKPGQVAHQTYRITIEDSQGKTHAETVRITVTGAANTGGEGGSDPILPPTLNVHDVDLFAGQSASLASFISGSLASNAHGSLTYTIEAAGLLDGWSIVGGTRNSDGSYTLTANQLAHATLLLPLGGLLPASLTVTATDTEANGVTSSVTRTISIAMHEAFVSLTNSGGVPAIQENGAIGFASALNFHDGSLGLDTVSIHISNLAPGWHLAYDDLSVPQAQADGSYLISEADIFRLLILPPAGFSGDVSQVFTASAVVQDPLGSYMTQPVTLGLSVISTDPPADTSGLSLTIGGVTEISENGAAGLASVLSIHDPAPGQDSLTVHITNLAPGWTLSFDDWSVPQPAADGSYTFLQADIYRLLILPPANYIGDQNHVFTITATATAGGVSTTTAPQDLSLQVNGPNGSANVTLNEGELFAFHDGDGQITIQNYVSAAAGGTDGIDLSSYHLGNIDFASLVQEVNGNAVITPIAGDHDDTITLLGVHKNQLTAADFHFA